VFERFTERARQVVVLAQEEARMLRHNYIGTEHLLLGLLREQEGLGARALESLGVTVEQVRDQVVQIIGFGEELTGGQIPFTPRTKKVLELSLNEALSLGHNYIGTEHLLLGLARENEGVAARILLDLDADAEKVRHGVISMLSGASERASARSMTTPTPHAPTGSLVIDRAWLGGLGAVLDDLASEIRSERQRAPDTADLLLALANAPDTLAAKALRELATNLDMLPGIIERLRAQALAEDQLARQLQELTEAQQQAIENLTRLHAQERELRQQADARAALSPEALQKIRQQLGLPAASTEDPPQPPPAG
jgi:ATP-dependent Clp protease ATP-binding subunit ClpA